MNYRIDVHVDGKEEWGHDDDDDDPYCLLSGNETCGEDEIIMTSKCNISIISYFPENGTHTLVLIMFNDISKVVYPINVNIYNGEKSLWSSLENERKNEGMIATDLLTISKYYFVNRKIQVSVTYMVVMDGFLFQWIASPSCHTSSFQYLAALWSSSS